MFNYNLNIKKLIRENLPASLHKPKRLTTLQVLLAPLKKLYQEFLMAKNDALYRASYNGGMNSLQKALNDKYDAVNRGIVIKDAFYDKTNIYKRSESQIVPILYRRWSSGVYNNVPAGVFCYHNGIVYEANTTVYSADVPGVSLAWNVTTRKPPVIAFKSNYQQAVTFYVFVPSAVVFDTKQMRAFINSFILAGPGYAIKIV